MKNKLGSVILLLYTLLMFIFAFNNKMISDIILAISANISNNNVTDVYNIIYYIFIFIVYFGYAIILTINCIEYLNSFKYILIYSILLNILLIILVSLVKSFYITINYIDLIISFISVFLGIGFEIIVKIKQIKGGKYEE